MPAGMTTESLRWAIDRFDGQMRQCASELNTLDGALGDGDLGVTLLRAAERLTKEAPNLPGDVGMALLKCAQAFTSVSASTFGTLLATGLMAAAKFTKGRTEVPWPEISPLLGHAVKAMSERGKGQFGDKTVLDAVEAARCATEGLADPEALVSAAGAAIDEAMERLRPEQFRQGRARIFGAKGIGLDDPGMVALRRIVGSLNG
ncbi:MAG: dihydroxyacetone kinase subunit L [Acidobacteriales bacterium]|nr:MAG: dihydroxyacetone kinase subunit L [Terriglobales bacterium]